MERKECLGVVSTDNPRERARTYLYQLKTIDKKIKYKMDEAQRWRDVAENRTSRLNDVKVQTSHVQDKMAEAITQALQYEQESIDYAKWLLDLKHTMITQIDEMNNDKDYLVLNLFFVQDEKYKDIAGELDCSYNQVKKQLRESINEFGKKYEKEISRYFQEKKDYYRFKATKSTQNTL